MYKEFLGMCYFLVSRTAMFLGFFFIMLVTKLLRFLEIRILQICLNELCKMVHEINVYDLKSILMYNNNYITM